MKTLLFCLIVYTIALLTFSFLHVFKHEKKIKKEPIILIHTTAIKKSFYSNKKRSGITSIQISYIQRYKSQSRLTKEAPVIQKTIPFSTKEKGFKSKIISIKPKTNEKLWKPIYGEYIRRSTAKANFQIYDAKGDHLRKNHIRNVKIWRHLNDELWIEDHAIFDEKESMIKCHGYMQQGIESGYYALEFDGGEYGYLAFEFEIKKNEVFYSKKFMPNYPKIIALHFVDHNGENIEYISSYPFNTIQRKKTRIKRRKTRKNSVLKNLNYQPDLRWESSLSVGNNLNFEGFGDDLIFFDFKNKKQKEFIRTHNGKFYFCIFAGNKNIISYAFDSAENKSKPFVFESTFMDDTSDNIKIEMNPINYDKENSVLLNKENPGNRKCLLTTPTATNLIEKNVDLNATSLVYNLLDNKHSIALENQHINNKNQIWSWDTIYSNDQGQYILNLDHIKFSTIKKFQVRWTDSKLFYSEWETISIEEGCC
ncbi:MAG: hypothetical protein COA79_24450 [Planctomycetota bacterium]|nr:MAG: hypothetical protein COA79_24450 [Planctomycetota bacterium]